jgi:hypothetical protein
MLKSAWIPVALLVVGCGSEPAGETRHEQQSIDVAGAQSARVELTMGAGELRVESGATKLVDAEFTYNLERLKPTVEQHTSGSETAVTIAQSQSASFNVGNVISRWDLRLNNDVPIDVIAKLGAGEAHMNLGDLILRRLDIGIGAGEVQVDLRGMPKGSYNVDIKGGVGQTTVYLPRTVGISASAAGGLGTIAMNGLEKRGERWINAGHESDPVQITIDIRGGIGEIQVNAR